MVKKVETKKLSIKERAALHKKNKGIFCVVQGDSGTGKTSLAGTLPGETFLIQAAGLETNSASAMKVAADNGVILDMLPFNSLQEIKEHVSEFIESDYDNLYIDGFSAFNEMVFSRADIQAAIKRDTWDGYRLIGNEMIKFILFCKDVTDNSNKNIFLTLATEEETDKAGQRKVKVDAKGRVGLSMLNRVSPNIVVLFRTEDEEGNSVRNMAIRSFDLYMARIDGVLDTNKKLPPVVEPNLSFFMGITDKLREQTNK